MSDTRPISDFRMMQQPSPHLQAVCVVGHFSLSEDGLCLTFSTLSRLFTTPDTFPIWRGAAHLPLGETHGFLRKYAFEMMAFS
jgi:hypothetical protein